jgi:hypothetical protein
MALYTHLDFSEEPEVDWVPGHASWKWREINGLQTPTHPTNRLQAVGNKQNVLIVKLV